ncbi:hypothetical protein ACJX0J_016227, partial [Zea mays]
HQNLKRRSGNEGNVVLLTTQEGRHILALKNPEDIVCCCPYLSQATPLLEDQKRSLEDGAEAGILFIALKGEQLKYYEAMTQGLHIVIGIFHHVERDQHIAVDALTPIIMFIKNESTSSWPSNNTFHSRVHLGNNLQIWSWVEGNTYQAVLPTDVYNHISHIMKLMEHTTPLDEIVLQL